MLKGSWIALEVSVIALLWCCRADGGMTGKPLVRAAG